MRMILKKIHIQNFKGCKEREIDFGNRTAIKGINGSGKTTIADAVMWVLFGKDSSGASTFDIRPRDIFNNEIDFIEIKVETVWDVDGHELTLVKTQKQKWVKKRGSEEQTYEGNENLFEINTIPKAEKEFKAYIANIIDEDLFKFVSNTNAFMAQKPMDRRKTLFKLVSDMTDADVLATDPKFAPLADQLAQFTSEEILSRDKKALFEYKRKLEEIPARIDEVSKSIVEQDYSEAEAKLQELRDQLISIEDDTSDASIYDQINQFKAEIAKLKGQLQEIEQQANADNRRKRSEIQQKIIDVDQQISSVTRSKQNAEREIEMYEKDISLAEKNLSDLAEAYKSEKAKEMPEDKNICPTCHREFDTDVKVKILADFEAEKDRQLKQIDARGKSVAETLKRNKEALERLKGQVFEYELQLRELNRTKENLQKEIETIPVSVDVSTDQDYVATKAALLKNEESLQAAQGLLQDANAKKQEIANRKRVIQNEIDSVNRILAGRQLVAQAKARVE